MVRVCLLLTFLTVTAHAAIPSGTHLQEPEAPIISSGRTVSTIPRTDPADIVRADVDAQTAKNWNAYLALRRAAANARRRVRRDYVRPAGVQ